MKCKSDVIHLLRMNQYLFADLMTSESPNYVLSIPCTPPVSWKYFSSVKYDIIYYVIFHGMFFLVLLFDLVHVIFKMSLYRL